MCPSFHVDNISSKTQLQESLSDWRRFVSGKGVDGGLFCNPAAVAQMIAFGKGQRLLVVTCSENGDPICFMPFVCSRRPLAFTMGGWRIGSVCADVVRLYDFEFPVRQGRNRLRLLIEAVPRIRQSVSCDMLFAQNCVLSTAQLPLPNVSMRRFTPVLRNVQRTFVLELPGSFESYLLQLRPKTRHNLKRQVTKLQAQCHDSLEAKRFSEAHEMALLNRHLNAVWQKSWHSEDGSGRPPRVPFLEAMAREGWVRSYVCFADGIPISYVEGYQYKGKYFYESVAYDMALAKYSPGAVLNYLMLQDLFKHDTPCLLDFGYGYNQYKESLGNVPQDRAEIWVVLSRKGRNMLTAMMVLDRVYHVARALASRTGLLKKLRAAIRKVT